VQGAEDLVDSIGKIPTPILNAGVGIAGMAGGALLLGGALVATLPKLLEFRSSFNEIAPAGSKARAGIDKVGKGAAIATAALVALQVAAAVFTEKHTKSAEDFGQALLKVAKAGDASGFDSIFGSFDKVNGVAVSNVDNMADAVKRLTNQNFDDAGNKFFEPFTSFIGLPKGEIGQLEDRLHGLGNAMGDLVKNGAGDTAAKNFQALTKEFEKNGKGAKEALESVPGYKDALLGLANQAHVNLEGQDLLDFAMGKVPASMQGAAGATETYTNAAGQAAPVTDEMSKALEEVGLSAQGAITNLDKFTQSLLSAGLLQLSARDAARGWSQALLDLGLNADGTGGKIGSLGTEFDNTTAKGIKNQAMFDGVAQAGIRNAETMAQNGASQVELQGALTNTYNGLIAAAGQFGITGDAAIALAREVLKVPPNVSIDAWIDDHASTTLEGIRGKADALNGKNVTVNINTIATTFERRVGLAPQVSDGSAGQGAGVYAPDFFPKKAVGGRVYGPGTSLSDSIPHMLSKDEYVVKASAAKAVGYGYLDALNGGYAPAPAPAPRAQATAVAAGAGGITFDFSGAQFSALDPVQLRRDITDDVTHAINTKGGMRFA
jgi:hypothetical protein